MRVDKTYVRVRGEWRHLYRGIDKNGEAVDFLLAARRDLDAAKRFFRKMLKDGLRRLKGAPGRGTLEKEKPPILGLIERGGQVVMRMLPNVQQKTIKPIIDAVVRTGSLIYTDEHDIYARLPTWGFAHQTICHAKGEYARDDDGDGFCEVHVNTMEGCWSLLRSWLRPHRGISQEKLPSYLGFFEFVHNARRRGKTLLAALVGVLVAPDTKPSP